MTKHQLVALDGIRQAGKSAQREAQRRGGTMFDAWLDSTLHALLWASPVVLVLEYFGLERPWAIGAGLLVALKMFILRDRLKFVRFGESLRWSLGARGEKASAWRLERARIRGERRGEVWYVFHDLAVPGSRANLDHLVINPYGVFLVDSKRWKSKHARLWMNGGHTLMRGQEQVRAETTAWEARVASVALGAQVTPLLSVSGRLPVVGYQVDGVGVHHVSSIGRVVGSGPKVLTKDEIVEAAMHTVLSFPQAA